MNKEQKEHMIEMLKKGIRLDGRGLEDFRPIEIETNIVGTAEGSAKIICGDAEIIAGVKMSLGTPFPDTPEEGVLMVNAELLPLSNPDFEAGPPSQESIEVSRVIDRGIRESKAIDVKKLCVEPGEKVWIINVDICPVNHDGNLIDLGSLAALAALKSAKIPEIGEDGNPDYKHEGKKGLVLEELPIAVTVVKIGDSFIVDPTDREMEAADARLTVTSLENGQLCALQKGGDSPLSLDEIKSMIDLAIKKGSELRELIKKL